MGKKVKTDSSFKLHLATMQRGITIMQLISLVFYGPGLVIKEENEPELSKVLPRRTTRIVRRPQHKEVQVFH